jgi:hypothetical protein
MVKILPLPKSHHCGCLVKWNNMRNQIVQVGMAMTTMAKMWLSLANNTMLTCQPNNVKEGDGRIWIYWHEIGNLVSFMMK